MEFPRRQQTKMEDTESCHMRVSAKRHILRNLHPACLSAFQSAFAKCYTIFRLALDVSEQNF